MLPGPVGKDGIRIGDLGAKAKPLARQLLHKRLDVFSAEYRKGMENIIDQEGGVDNLRLIFWGEASKSFHKGGKYHWRIGSGRVVCDWQTAGANHLHLTVRARAKG